MKKVISLVLIGILLISSFAFADTTPVPVLISVERFELEQDGDEFTIILDENVSTGYTWSYTINDDDHVTVLKDETVSDTSGLLGASGKRQFTFKVNANGVSTIQFVNEKHLKDDTKEVAETLDILVYKTDDQTFVEEDKMAYATDTSEVLDGEVMLDQPMAVFYNDTELDLDVTIQVKEEVTMIPLAEPLRAMGYTVKWDGPTQTVEISKGAQWTSITIGKNAYFKNKMAARPLSAAPVIEDGRTLVPAEFFSLILDLGFEIENGDFKLNDYQMGHVSGLVKEIVRTETGDMQLVIADELEGETTILVHTSSAFTYFQKAVNVGDAVNIVTSMVQTMSLPPQTSGYIVY